MASAEWPTATAVVPEAPATSAPVLAGASAVRPLALSETKTSILRHLERRRMTSSEAARALHIHRTAAQRHLHEMTASGLVLRCLSARKWIYYELSPRGASFLRQLGEASNPHDQRGVERLGSAGPS
jgi:DNA-binding MarR family transcriptional regulator